MKPEHRLQLSSTLCLTMKTSEKEGNEKKASPPVREVVKWKGENNTALPWHLNRCWASISQLYLSLLLNYILWAAPFVWYYVNMFYLSGEQRYNQGLNSMANRLLCCYLYIWLQYWLDGWDVGIQFPAGLIDFSLHCVQTSSRAYPASYFVVLS